VFQGISRGGNLAVWRIGARFNGGDTQFTTYLRYRSTGNGAVRISGGIAVRAKSKANGQLARVTIGHSMVGEDDKRSEIWGRSRFRVIVAAGRIAEEP